MSDNGVPAEPRLASIKRQQLVLRSIDVEQLVDEDHSARLIWQLIGRLDLSLYYAEVEGGGGRLWRRVARRLCSCQRNNKCGMSHVFADAGSTTFCASWCLDHLHFSSPAWGFSACSYFQGEAGKVRITQ